MQIASISRADADLNATYLNDVSDEVRQLLVELNLLLILLDFFFHGIVLQLQSVRLVLHAIAIKNLKTLARAILSGGESKQA